MDAQRKAYLRERFNDIFATQYEHISQYKRHLRDYFGLDYNADETYKWINQQVRDYDRNLQMIEEEEQKRLLREQKEADRKALEKYKADERAKRQKIIDDKRKQQKEEQKKIVMGRLCSDIKRFGMLDQHRIEITRLWLNHHDITNEELMDLIIKCLPNLTGKKGVFIRYGDGKYYPLNDTRINIIKDILVNGKVKIEETKDSDKMALNVLFSDDDDSDIILTSYKPKHNTTESSAFFKFKNKCDKIDLKRYGILNVNDDVDKHKKLIITNCLYTALRVGGMEKEKLDQFKGMGLGSYIPLAKYKMICEELDISIKVKKEIKTKHNENTTRYGNSDEEYYVGVIDEHAFIIEDVKYNSYAVKNYFDICERPDWFKYRSDVKKEMRYINSYDLIKILFHNKETHLQPLTNDDVILQETPYEGNDDFSYEGLKYAIDTNENKPYGVEYEDDNEIIDVEQIRKDIAKDQMRKRIEWKNCFIDFETRNDVKNHIKPFMGVMKYEHQSYTHYSFNNGDDYDSDKCVIDLLNKMEDDTKLIIQNAKFDFNFIIDKLHSVKIIENAGRIITANGMYYKKRIMVVDFINYTGMSLKSCGSSFKLNIHKEYMPYRLYDDYDVIKNKYVNIQDAINKYDIKGDDLETFNNNIINWKLKNNDTYDANRYCLEYCKLDVYVLEQSYIKFRNMIKDELKINIDACEDNDFTNTLTISSLAKKYSQQQGYFTGGVSNSGVIREFIQKSIVGGRTMISDNKKQRVKDMTPYDANSLYPSAINRLGGFLIGKPKMWNKDIDLNKCDGYNLHIKILSHEKDLCMPLFSVMEKGKRNFTNDMDNKEIYVGKIALEDLVKYQGIKYEILNGIYWDEGRTKVDIDSLYQTRLRYKKEKDVKETIYKLVLNSIYGFTIMKEHNTEIVVKDNHDDMMKYISKNFNWIISSERIKDSDKWIIKRQSPTEKHLNYNHIGCEVLDMSKRIMNEVVCMLEDKGCKNMYQDTDSVFMPNEYVKYMTDYEGIELGHFKPDFGKHKDTGISITSTDNIFLGKKCYYCELDNGEDKYRMKGIPATTIKHYGRMNNLSVKEIYEKLYNGETLTFDLCERDENDNILKFKVDNCSNRQMERKTRFTRNIKF